MVIKVKSEDACCCLSASERGGLRVLWEITHGCNLHCPHCLLAERTHELSDYKIIKIAHMLVADGVKKVIISGGEPLTHPVCLEVVEILSNAGIQTDLATNATLLTENTIQFLGQQGVECSISLDGPNAEIHETIRGSSTFIRTTNNITHLVNSGVNVQALMVVTNLNWKYVRETIDLANRLACVSITINGLLPLGKANVSNDLWIDQSAVNELRQIVEEARRFYNGSMNIRTTRLFSALPLQGCFAGRTIVHIDPGGQVNPCALLKNATTHKLFMPDMGLKEILNHPTFREMRNSLTLEMLKKSIPCPLSCAYYENCGRGCRGLVRTGLDPLCLYKERGNT